MLRIGHKRMQFCLTYIDQAQEGQTEEKRQKGISLFMIHPSKGEVMWVNSFVTLDYPINISILGITITSLLAKKLNKQYPRCLLSMTQATRLAGAGA
jgi:hypothetical protein